MAPPLPAILAHCAVFSTSSALVANAVLGLARQLVNTAGSLPARPFSWSSRCRGGDRSGQAARHHSRGSAPGRSWYPHVSGPIRRCHRRRPRSFGCRSGSRVWPTHHAHAGGTRQIPIAPARRPAGFARSGFYEIAFAILAATVVPSDLAETSRLSRREAPAVTNQKS